MEKEGLAIDSYPRWFLWGHTNPSVELNESEIIAYKNLRWYCWFNACFGGRFYYGVRGAMFLAYGLTLQEWTSLNSIWAITVTLLEIPSGALADVCGRKNLVVASAFLYFLEMFLLAIMPRDLSVVFWFCLGSRICGGLADAAASGADQALLYDSLKNANLEKQWPTVLAISAYILVIPKLFCMTFGAMVFDPYFMQYFFSYPITNNDLCYFPAYLSLLAAFGSIFAAAKLTEVEYGKEQQEQQRNVVTLIKESFITTLKTTWWMLTTKKVVVSATLTILTTAARYNFILNDVSILASTGLSYTVLGLVRSLMQVFNKVVISRLIKGLIYRNYSFEWIAGFSLLTHGIGHIGPYLFLGFMHNPVFALFLFTFTWTGVTTESMIGSYYLNRECPSYQRATAISVQNMGSMGVYAILAFWYGIILGDDSDSLHDTLWFPALILSTTIVVTALTDYCLVGFNYDAATSAVSKQPKRKKT